MSKNVEYEYLTEEKVGMVIGEDWEFDSVRNGWRASQSVGEVTEVADVGYYRWPKKKNDDIMCGCGQHSYKKGMDPYVAHREFVGERG